MGADSFSTVAWGRTPHDAFRSAVNAARYDRGHGGYTGTIAEKGDFDIFLLPPRTKVGKFLDLVAEHRNRQIDSAREEPARLEGLMIYTSSADKPVLRRRIKESKATLAKLEKAHARFVKRAGPLLLPLVERAARVYDDKWGPAVAVEVKQPSEVALFTRYSPPKPKRGYRLFVFTGMASS